VALLFGVVSFLGLLNVVLAMFGYGSDGEPARPDIKRWHPVAIYLIGLAIPLLVLAGLFGLIIVLVRVTYPVALAIVSILLAGLLGLMIVLVRFYRER
jgi:hypothetical protein